MAVTVGEPFEDAHGQWRVSVGLGGSGPDKQVELGPFRSLTAAKREGAKFRNKLDRRERAEALVDLAKIGEPDGTLSWYGRAMDLVAQKVLMGGGREARDDLKALAFAANSRKQLQDVQAVEDELRALRAAVADIRSARKYGTRTTQPDTVPAGDDLSAGPIH